ncbi:MAG: response regulator [Thermodesulfovibrionales bacterium]|nr:response regulator [Thermodesulfovibrionales bacterium]
MTILIVDDENECRESLGELLRFAGYRVATAASGEDALGILRDRTINIRLMLVDFMMPGMNGEEFIRKARQEGHMPKALIVTAFAPWQTAGITKYGIGYLRKPYEGSVLLNTVERLLR